MARQRTARRCPHDNCNACMSQWIEW
ncbi:hypothetical protein [Paenibacillus sp. RC84]